MIGIYAIYRKSDDRCLYVGQSKNLEHRIYAHTCPSGMFYNQDVYHEFVETFDYYDKENQLNREAHWIDELDPELNKFKNRTWNEEQRKQISERNTGTVFTPERCKHISEALIGKKYGPIHKEKCKKRMMGNTINNDRVHINKNGVNKNVHRERLQSYIDDGWQLGWKCRPFVKKWMNDGTRNKYVLPEEINEYESKGWKLGFITKNK